MLQYLGQLIRHHREEKGYSRTKFAQMCDISPNSMVKYEMAGEPTGKYPAAKNLVKICEILEIDPRKAFDYIKNEDHDAATQKYLKDHPEADQIDPYGCVDFGLKFQYHFRTDIEWLNTQVQVRSIRELNEHLGDQTVDLHYIDRRLENIEWRLDGKDPKEERAKEKAEWKANFDEEMKKNDPDQNDLSRSNNSTNNTEAVDAASIKNQHKGGT